MPWVRFDDQFTIHRKVDGLSDTAFRLHVAAIFWCARNLTDGFVPEGDLAIVSVRVRAPGRFAAECVDRDLWHTARDRCASPDCPASDQRRLEANAKQNASQGWFVHDYFAFQPSRNKVLRDRETRAKAGHLGGIASGESRRSPPARSKRKAKPKQDASRSLHPRTRTEGTNPPAPEPGGSGEHHGQHKHCRACGTNLRGEPPPTPTPPPYRPPNGHDRVASEDVADLLASTRNAITSPQEGP